jgi:hypothetical protein
MRHLYPFALGVRFIVSDRNHDLFVSLASLGEGLNI